MLVLSSHPVQALIILLYYVDLKFDPFKYIPNFLYS